MESRPPQPLLRPSLRPAHGSNTEGNHLVDAYGSRRIETYRLYEKELTDIPDSSIVVLDRHESAASKEQPAYGL